MKKKCVGNIKKKLYSEIRGNDVSEGGGGIVYENPVRLFIYDGPMKTVEYMREYIWCMLD